MKQNQSKRKPMTKAKSQAPKAKPAKKSGQGQRIPDLGVNRPRARPPTAKLEAGALNISPVPLNFYSGKSPEQVRSVEKSTFKLKFKDIPTNEQVVANDPVAKACRFSHAIPCAVNKGGKVDYDSRGIFSNYIKRGTTIHIESLSDDLVIFANTPLHYENFGAGDPDVIHTRRTLRSVNLKKGQKVNYNYKPNDNGIDGPVLFPRTLGERQVPTLACFDVLFAQLNTSDRDNVDPEQDAVMITFAANWVGKSTPDPDLATESVTIMDDKGLILDPITLEDFDRVSPIPLGVMRVGKTAKALPGAYQLGRIADKSTSGYPLLTTLDHDENEYIAAASVNTAKVYPKEGKRPKGWTSAQLVVRRAGNTKPFNNPAWEDDADLRLCVPTLGVLPGDDMRHGTMSVFKYWKPTGSWIAWDDMDDAPLWCMENAGWVAGGWNQNPPAILYTTENVKSARTISALVTSEQAARASKQVKPKMDDNTLEAILAVTAAAAPVIAMLGA